ncbi:MAG: histidinol-phosphate transaminase, partial [Bacillota bacterium]
THFKLHEDNNYQLKEDFLDVLTKDLDMLFLCNPNNPTGQLISKKFLLKILQRCREQGILLFIDECFNEFLEEPAEYSIKEYLQKYNNLLILKAFTKIYAMAGIRLGHCITSNRELIKKLHEAGQPWSVSSPAQFAGIQAIKEREYLARAKALIGEERDYLTEILKKLNFTVFPPNANYIFIKDSYTRERPLHEMLFEKGILIRNCDNYHGLGPGYYRICIRKHEDNLKLVETLHEVID